MAFAMLSTLQRFVHWLAGGVPAPAAATSPAIKNVAAAARPACFRAPFRPESQARQRVTARCYSPVRVVHGSGRMVISGRMADVCAELDRLAAAEA